MLIWMMEVIGGTKKIGSSIEAGADDMLRRQVLLTVYTLMMIINQVNGHNWGLTLMTQVAS